MTDDWVTVVDSKSLDVCAKSNHRLLHALLSVEVDIWFSPRAQSGRRAETVCYNHKSCSTNAVCSRAHQASRAERPRQKNGWSRVRELTRESSLKTKRFWAAWHVFSDKSCSTNAVCSRAHQIWLPTTRQTSLALPSLKRATILLAKITWAVSQSIRSTMWLRTFG